MKKIPFDISYKDDIIAGKVKVVTRNDSPVEIQNFGNTEIGYPITGTIKGDYDEDDLYVSWTIKGKYSEGFSGRDDLFLLIDEEHPKFKVGEMKENNMSNSPAKLKTSRYSCQNFIDEGTYLLPDDCEAKILDDKLCIKKKEPTDFERSVRHIMEETLECGDTHNYKADAELLLAMARKEIEKDLPKWVKDKYDDAPYAHIGGFNLKYLIKNGYAILISDLDKLPKIE